MKTRTTECIIIHSLQLMKLSNKLFEHRQGTKVHIKETVVGVTRHL